MGTTGHVYYLREALRTGRGVVVPTSVPDTTTQSIAHSEDRVVGKRCPTTAELENSTTKPRRNPSWIQFRLHTAGIEDNIIGLLTGHKSRELRRYQHLREELKRKTLDLIAVYWRKLARAETMHLVHAYFTVAKNGPRKPCQKALSN